MIYSALQVAVMQERGAVVLSIYCCGREFARVLLLYCGGVDFCEGTCCDFEKRKSFESTFSGARQAQSEPVVTPRVVVKMPTPYVPYVCRRLFHVNRIGFPYGFAEEFAF